MNNEIEFIQRCNPPTSTAQGSSTILKTRSGRYFVGKKSTSKAKAAQDFWLWLFSQHKPEAPLEGGVVVDLILHFPWQKSARKRDKDTIQPMIQKPDLDNLTKIILDVGTKLGYWHDDSQVFNLSVIKYRSPSPGVIFRATNKIESFVTQI